MANWTPERMLGHLPVHVRFEHAFKVITQFFLKY
jgi:hypothetical protein